MSLGGQRGFQGDKTGGKSSDGGCGLGGWPFGSQHKVLDPIWQLPEGTPNGYWPIWQLGNFAVDKLRMGYLGASVDP